MAAEVVAVATLAWVAAYTLPRGVAGSSGWALRQARLSSLRAVRVADIVASARPVASLLRWEACRSLCDAVVERWPSLLVTRERALGALLIGLAGSSAAGALIASSPVGLLMVPACAAMGVSLWASARRRRAQAELVAEMPGVLRTLALALGSGETLAQAIEYVGVNGVGPAGRAFARASLSLRCGTTVEEALGSLAAELDAPGVGLLVSALLVAQRTGSPLAALLQRSASLVERAGEFERLLAVRTAQVRLSVRVVCLLPAVLVVGLSLMSADFQHGLMTPVGLACVAVATLVDLLAIVVIRHIMAGVL